MPNINILSSGNTSAPSSWFTVAPNVVHTLLLRGRNGRVGLEFQGADGQPEEVHTMNTTEKLGKTTQVFGPITYRVNRPAQADSLGVDQIT
jgi:hypothetical protein